MKVIWSPQAAYDLVENNRYIARENPDAARAIVNNNYEYRKRIKEFPTQGRVVPEIGQQDIREIFCGSYRIIYQIEAKKILILTIRHMKQEITKDNL
jgi:plasmid stabilization system protein ParE